MKAFGSAFFGLFMGLLIGLSSSPVVGLIVGTLVTVLGAIIGIVKKDSIKVVRGGYLMIGFFSLCASIGVLAGLKIRTEQIWGRDLQEDSKKWHQILSDSVLAEKIIIYEHTGLVVDPTIKVDERAAGQAIKASVLFSITASEAEKLDPENFQQAEDVYDAWREEGEIWEEYANAIDNKFQKGEQLNAYKTVWTMLK